MPGNSRTRQFVIAAFLLAAVLAGAWWYPTYEKRQKIFDAWVRADETTHGWWQMVPDGMGPWAVPLIEARLEAENSFWTRTYRNLWPKLPKIIRTRFREPKPANMLATRDAEEMFKVACASHEGTAALLKELHNGNRDVREAAIGALQSFAGKTLSTNEALEAFPPFLPDKNPMVQLYAAMGLGRIGAAASNAVPSMIPLLSANESMPAGGRAYIRGNTAMALAKIGPPAISATPQLRILMANGDSFQRLAAALALWSITSNVSETLPVFIKEMPNYTSNSIFFPATALQEMGPRAKTAYPTLAAERNNGRGSYNEKLIANALKSIDPEAAAKDGIK